MAEVARYSRKDAAAWDAFVDCARNGHFFFKRGYLEYHSDRFLDHSYLFRHKGRVEALLAANLADDVLYSHQGLTFGGLLVDELGGAGIRELLESLCRSLREVGIRKLVYKPVPPIFHRQPMQEDLYFLHILGARLVRRDLSSVLDLQAARNYAKGKKANLRRAATAGLTCAQEGDAEPVMALLEDVLGSRHSARPTHTCAEMELLHRRFPDNIKIYAARRKRQIVAGAIIFLNPTAVHTQYLANNDEGREVGALDFLIDNLIVNEFKSWRWLSFGISTDDMGRKLNLGLLQFKEAFAARGIVHDVYELDL